MQVDPGADASPTGTSGLGMPGVAERIRRHDWSATPLGARETWPQSLRTTLDIMLGSGHAMCLAWGPDRTFLYNDAYAPFLGARHPSALGMGFAAVWPEIWGEIGPLVDRVFAGETTTFHAMPLVMTRNGFAEDTWWDFSYSPVRDERGAVAGLLNVAADATPRVLAERERDRALADQRASQDRLAALVSASSDSLYTMSPDWQEMRSLEGRGFITDTTTPSVRWMDVYLFPEDRDEVRRAIERAIERVEPFELEHRVRRPDGSEGWTHSRAVPILGDDGEIVEWFGLAADVTARRQATEALRESESFMRGVLSSSTDCIKVLDLDARLVFMSEGGQEVMEVSDFNDVVGCPWPDFWQEAGNLAARQAIAEAQTGRSATFQGYADTMKGNRRYWDVQVSPILGRDGRPERILSVSRDVSALKASEEARAVLVQEMAHRMKNTLAMVQAVVTQTLRQAASMEAGRLAVSQRLTALGRAQDILTRSDFSEADVGDVVAAAIDPHRVAEDRITWAGPAFGLTAQQALGLSLAIHELATNAAKYGALANETGRVAMSWDVADGAFSFLWTETGGPPVGTPESRGFGSKLIERIVASYFNGEGRIDFDPAGIRFRLTGAAAAAPEPD
ncbi:PAS domain-containing protein [Aureimonas flava]|nr:PAS domain-containing protein [Aureimonas flava]